MGKEYRDEVRQLAMGIRRVIRDWFKECEPANPPTYTCPCCGYITLGERGVYDICVNCFWEDDGNEKEEYWREIPSGPNAVSLREAQLNYVRYGACEPRCVDLVVKHKHREYAKDPNFKLLPPVDLTGMEPYEDMSNARAVVMNKGYPDEHVVMVGTWRWRKVEAVA